MFYRLDYSPKTQAYPPERRGIPQKENMGGRGEAGEVRLV